MANFAILNQENIVTMIVVADSIEGPESIFSGNKIIPSTEENPANTGWTWDGTTFVAPVTE